MGNNATSPTSNLTGSLPDHRRRAYWRWGISLAVLLLLLLLFGGISPLALASPPPTIVHVVYDPGIAAIISQVTTQTLEYELNGLTGERPVVVDGSSYTIAARQTYNSGAISMATQYTYEQFVSFGLTTTYHYYVWDADLSRGLHSAPPNIPSGPRRNVIAEKPGRVDPQRIYLLTAHMDDMPIGMRAPGADDNASGSVAVLTAARLLAPHDFAYTIRLVLFTGEEQGLQGSIAYAADCAAREEDIRGVINLDMIAHNTDSAPIIDLYASSDIPGSLALTRDFAYVIDVYGLKLIPDRFSDPAGLPVSDQGSFVEYGYPVMLAIEDQYNFNPYYHKITDRVSILHLDYYADVTRAVVATVAHLAVPI